MIVRLGLVRASLVRVSSGFSPHARIISLRASILLRRVLGFMLKPAAMYMPRRYSVLFILMSWYLLITRLNTKTMCLYVVLEIVFTSVRIRGEQIPLMQLSRVVFKSPLFARELDRSKIEGEEYLLRNGIRKQKYSCEGKLYFH